MLGLMLVAATLFYTSAPLQVESRDKRDLSGTTLLTLWLGSAMSVMAAVVGITEIYLSELLPPTDAPPAQLVRLILGLGIFAGAQALLTVFGLIGLLTYGRDRWPQTSASSPSEPARESGDRGV